jgi:hypothetical protein
MLSLNCLSQKRGPVQRQLTTIFGVARRSTLPQIHKIRLLCWSVLLEMPTQKCV